MCSYRLLVNVMGITLLVAMFMIVQKVQYLEEMHSEMQSMRQAFDEFRMSAEKAAKSNRDCKDESGKAVKSAAEQDEPKGNSMAIQNRNPLNVKALGKGDKWRGQIGVDKHGHAIFESWEYGFRAASITLRSYARKHKIDTIEGVVHRFAQGNRAQYIRYLSRKLGVGPREKIDLMEYMPHLLRHMSRFESGQDMPDRFIAPYDVLANL